MAATRHQGAPGARLPGRQQAGWAEGQGVRGWRSSRLAPGSALLSVRPGWGARGGSRAQGCSRVPSLRAISVFHPIPLPSGFGRCTGKSGTPAPAVGVPAHCPSSGSGPLGTQRCPLRAPRRAALLPPGLPQNRTSALQAAPGPWGRGPSSSLGRPRCRLRQTPPGTRREAAAAEDSKEGAGGSGAEGQHLLGSLGPAGKAGRGAVGGDLRGSAGGSSRAREGGALQAGGLPPGMGGEARAPAEGQGCGCGALCQGSRVEGPPSPGTETALQSWETSENLKLQLMGRGRWRGVVWPRVRGGQRGGAASIWGVQGLSRSGARQLGSNSTPDLLAV